MSNSTSNFHNTDASFPLADKLTQPVWLTNASAALSRETFIPANDSTNSQFLPPVSLYSSQNNEMASVYNQFLKYVPSASDKSEKPTDKPSAPDESKKPTDKKLTYNEKVQKEFLIALNEFRQEKGLKPIKASESLKSQAKENSDRGFGHNILPKSYLQDVAWVPQHTSKSPRALARQLLKMWQGDSGHLRPLITRNAKLGGIGISGDVITLNMA
jgi:hypothetical protein